MTQIARPLVTDHIHAEPSASRARYDVTNSRTHEIVGTIVLIMPCCWQAFDRDNVRVGDADGYLEPRQALVPLVAAYRVAITRDLA
jgi:hypothetical protein